MANKGKLAIPVQKTVQAADAASLDTAVAAAVNVIANNVIGVCDSTGTLTGNQNVIQDSIQIVVAAPFYDTGASADVYTSTILSTVITQLT